MVPGLLTKKTSHEHPSPTIKVSNGAAGSNIPAPSLFSKMFGGGNVVATKKPSSRHLSTDASASYLADHGIIRHPLATPAGGLTASQEDLARAKAASKDVLKQFGMNVLRGSNLTTITFPAKCSEPRTILMKFSDSLAFAPRFLTLAAAHSSRSATLTEEQAVDRMSNVIAFYVAGLHCATGCLKPFNPVLGETLQVVLDSDTTLYMEQSSHHPPVSCWLLIGPQYRYYGNMTYKASLGMNEVRLQNIGERIIKFENGDIIHFDFPADVFSGAIFGTFTHNTIGEVTFTDEKNSLVAIMEFGKQMKGQRTDHVEGAIYSKASDGTLIELVPVIGSWVSHLDIGSNRIWAYGKIPGVPTNLHPDPLPSDSIQRADLSAIAENDIEKAQACKVHIEEEQRHLRKLRQSKRP